MASRAGAPPRWPLVPLLVPLLLTCLTGLDGGAVSAHQPAEPAAGEACLASTLDLLWSTVGRIVRSAVEPEVAELDGRLAGLQTQLTELTVRLDRIQGGQEAQNSTVQIHLQEIDAGLKKGHLDFTSKVDGVQSQVTELMAKIDDIQGEQQSQNVSLQRQLQGMVEGLGKLNSDLRSILDGIQAQTEARLGTVHAELESKLDRVQSQIDTRLGQVQSQLESRLADVQSSPARDCSDLPAGARSGVHLLRPGLRQPVPALCDQDTDGGGWTVFQRRADIQPRQDFFLGWEAYKWGFGALDGEFWWGLEHLFHTTSLLDRRYELRIDMEDFDGEKRFALYQDFKISSEADGYRLHAANYSAGDILPLAGF
ncbi:Microfibril-associated glycoprotein 4 [Amphibalanus amphitrite]|uniref:Microfibril-associated glycoprotein 4 n=1 Tax=Amphibalanus amphitrite TaxID=1232801 RepID=A0A6A4WCV6_AMPAM|nr:Microfibril-associated glycoprotein 4 [Amphibalanus amphitrite]